MNSIIVKGTKLPGGMGDVASVSLISSLRLTAAITPKRMLVAGTALQFTRPVYKGRAGLEPLKACAH